MNSDLILEMIDLAIVMAENELHSTDLEHTFLDIIEKGVQGYEDHTGAVLDPALIGLEQEL